ncbi:karyopherin (importin) beta 3 [Anaeramoeba ignava]|uniref:Karyopherin (Importin) beta 3 n=1 Tax=Anaeramoeba ignava TaxID=1746090 RepID=A0A9Q0LS52_ANAIG|nr:karyopherin (importin) beta 3 [Anaeramoeba ignava]
MQNFNNLENILLKILSPNNEERKNSEQKYWDLCDFSTQEMILKLISTFEITKHLPVKLLSMVLLRQIFYKDIFQENESEKNWNKFSQDQQNSIIEKLIQFLNLDEKIIVKRKVCDLIVILVQDFDETTWQQMFKFILDQLQDSNIKDLMLYLLEQIVFYSPSIFENITNELFQIQSNFIHENNPFQIRLLSFNLICSQVQIAKKNERDSLKIASFFNSKFLVTFIEKADQNLLENFNEDILRNLILLPIEMMLEIEENEDWENEELLPSSFKTAQTNLQIISKTFQEPILSIISSILQELFSSQNWKNIIVGLGIISAISEGIPNILVDQVQEIVQEIQPFSQNSNPRILYQLYLSISQICIHLSPQAQKKTNQILIPIISLGINQMNYPKIQIAALDALIDFCYYSSSNTILTPFAQEILENLMQLISCDIIEVQEKIITAISFIAQASKNQFEQYYHSLMDFLKRIYLLANKIEFQTLKAKTFLCMGLIGNAVGKPVFAKDAIEIMESFDSNDFSFEENSQCTLYILRSWKKILNILNTDFYPFLQKIFPIVFQQAAKQPDMFLVTPFNESHLDPKDHDFIILGDQKIAIRNSSIKEKYQSLKIIDQVVDIFSEIPFEFIQETQNIIISNYTFIYDENIRIICAEITIKLLKIYLNLQNKQNVNQDELFKNIHSLLLQIFQYLSIAINQEIEPRVIQMFTWSFKKLLKLSQNTFGSDFLEPFIQILFNIIKEGFERISRIFNNNDSPDLEMEKIIKQSTKTERWIQFNISKILSLINIFHHNHFIQINGNGLFDLFKNYLIPNQLNSPVIQEFLIDFILILLNSDEPQLIQPIISEWTPYIISNSNISNYFVSKKFVDFINLFSTKYTQLFLPFAQDSLIRLHLFISSDFQHFPQKLIEEVQDLHDFAIFVFGNVCKNSHQTIDFQDSFHNWLIQIPLLVNNTSTNQIYQLFWEFIETKNEQVFGQDLSQLPIILSIIANSFSFPSQIIEESVLSNFVMFLKELKENLSEDQFSQLMNSLEPQLSSKLTNFF